MDQEGKAKINEVYHKSKQVGELLQQTIEHIEQLKKQNLPDDIAEKIEELSEYSSQALKQHFGEYQLLIKTGAVEKPDQYLQRPVLKKNELVEDYNIEKICRSIENAGLTGDVVSELAELATKELESRFGLGGHIVHTRYIHHVIYQVMLNTGHFREACNYKEYSKPEKPLPHRGRPISHRSRKRTGHMNSDLAPAKD